MEDYLKTALAHCRNEIVVLNAQVDHLNEIIKIQEEQIEILKKLNKLN
jgi:hypothetical protein